MLLAQVCEWWYYERENRMANGNSSCIPSFMWKEKLKDQFDKRHWSAEMAWMLLAKMSNKCEQNLLFVQVWTQVSLAQMLKLGMLKGQYDEEALIGWKTIFVNLN